MDEKIFRCRQMLANAAMFELHAETRKLIDKFGYSGAETYLQAQLAILDDAILGDLRDSKSEGDKNVF